MIKYNQIILDLNPDLKTPLLNSLILKITSLITIINKLYNFNNKLKNNLKFLKNPLINLNIKLKITNIIIKEIIYNFYRINPNKINHN